MSFGTNPDCESGLYTAIYQSFEAYDHIQIYIPANTMKFTIAAQKASDALGLIYAYVIYFRIQF